MVGAAYWCHKQEAVIFDFACYSLELGLLKVLRHCNKCLVSPIRWSKTANHGRNRNRQHKWMLNFVHDVLWLFICCFGYPYGYMHNVGHAKRLSNKSNKRNAQSAMEYLMTYGWAILIISIVLAVLWSLGLFSRSPAGGGGAACVGTIGYLCGTPLLASNGLLLTSIGQTASGSAITVTGLGCSNTSVQPSTFSFTSLTLPPSQSASVAFSCSLPTSAVGSPFSGTLWIKYNLGTATGLISRLGTVNTKVTQNSGAAAYVFSATTSFGGTVLCGSVPCTGSYAPGNSITITATPNTNNAFSSWAGTSCSSISMNPCTVTMPTGADSEEAIFYSVPVALETGQSQTQGIAVNNGNVYWTDYGSGSVMEYTSGGSLLTLATGQSSPYGIAVSSSGNVYWTDYGSGNIMEYTSGGSLLPPLATGQSSPHGIAVSSSGNVYWTNDGSGTIMEYTSGGSLVTLETGRTAPMGIVVDGNGNVYWVEFWGSGPVMEYTSGGSLVTLNGGQNYPRGVAVDNHGNVYWTNDGSGTVMEYTYWRLDVDSGNKPVISLWYHSRQQRQRVLD